MTKINAREGSPLIQWGAISVLGLVNVAVFHAHYFGNDCFPWDFWKAYYTIIPFWTTAVSQHVLPEWVPFEGMGYPFFINLQSSFFYPPLWFFVLPGIHYSLHAAVIMQCLHVFWGACGAFLLLRVLTSDWRSALFGAMAYQFFGGFYSNAEHMDIVRAYAWLPWLFWGATVKGELQVRNLLLPVIFYCVATASYPGNMISHGTFLGIYILYQFCQRSPRSNWKNLLILVGLLVVGILLSIVALGPVFLLRDQLTRASEKVMPPPWLFSNWLSAIAPWTAGKSTIRGYFGDPSMISAFVGVPTLALIILMRRVTAKAFAVWFLLLIIALVLAQGGVSTFYHIAVTVVPVLGLSRMAPSDYRGLLGLSLIVLAAGSLSTFLATTRDAHRELIRKRFKYLCLIPAIVMSGVFPVLLPLQELVWLLIFWGATVIVLYVRWPRFMGSDSLLSAVLLMSVVVAGGWHVISVSNWTWTAGGTDVDDLYKRSIGFSTCTWPVPVAEKIRGVPIRPARVDRKRADFSWTGYLDGTYQMSDWNNTVLKARAQVEGSPVLLQYMRLPLTLLVFPHTQHVSLDMVRDRLGQEPGAFEQQSEVIPDKYGMNSIAYNLTLSADSIVVENEIWFPGWKGTLVRDTETIGNVQPISVDKTLRAWRLPAGQYKFVTQFRTPYLRVCAIVSMAGLLIYLALLAMAYRSWRARMQILHASAQN
jgi:hypothetical protein